MVPISDTSLYKNSETMAKINEQEILQGVKMDASVNFMANGDINIYPCPWEDEKEATNGGKRVRYKGGVEVDSDGRTRVKRYNVGAKGPKHDVLFETAHGAVKMTRANGVPNDERTKGGNGFVYVTFKFPKRFGATLTRSCLAEEADEVIAYLKARKEETIWS